MSATQNDDDNRRSIWLHIPFATFLKACLVLLLIYVLSKLWPVLLLVLIAVLLAITLMPAVQRLEKLGLKRWAGLLTVMTAVVVALVAGLSLLCPAIYEQAISINKSLPQMRDKLVQSLPQDGFLRHGLEHVFVPGYWPDVGKLFDHLVYAGGQALGIVAQFVLLLATTFYLMIDGAKVYLWALAFFPRTRRQKIKETTDEVSEIIFNYVAGQALISALAFVFSFAVLSLLHVPAALTLSLLAGVLDIIPILGFLISTVAAFMVALGVSPATAFLILGCYLAYHAFEAYFLLPRVWGQKLRISKLAVLLALIGGGTVAGIPGAILALPLVASYAAIERIWLADYLGEAVPEAHERQKNAEFGKES